MLQALKEAGIPNKLIKLIHTTLNGSKAVVTLESEFTDESEISVCIRQGYILPAVLFNLTLKMIIRKVDVWENLSTTLKQICVYADDTVITVITKKALIETFIALERDANQTGLIINGDKTKYMVCTRMQNINVSNLSIAEYNLNSVSSFIYLGTKNEMEIEKTMYGGCVGRLTNYENNKLETESHQQRSPE